MIPAAKNVLDQLETHHNTASDQRIADLFASNPNRFDAFSASCGQILFDYSKNNVTDETLILLFGLAEAAQVRQKIQALFAGNHVNLTEDRAVQHMALRNRSGGPVIIDGQDVMPDVLDVHARMVGFANGVRDGTIAASGGAFTDVVNIGIGGSDLGPAMVTAALAPYHNGPKIHFVSNVDGADIHAVLEQVPAETTLFMIASKTFTTQETMTNAGTAREWFVKRCGETAVATHFAALSTALDKTSAFGISDQRAFGFWDWVGGRYSVWSAIGLPVMLAVGSHRFEEFLSGAHEVDNHFRETADRDNIPVLMALIGIYHRNVCGYETHAVLPYDQHLHRFTAYLQQLDMESNGKRIDLDGNPVGHATGPVVWG